ncbi:MAG: type II/IV secretion system protein [Arcobacter sp.]|nr:type II/IV secretion system protein [Arcobacter sp.]
MKIINHIIDYNFVNSFDINTLRESLSIPLKSEDIYFTSFTCVSSDISKVYTKSLIKSIELEKEEILFFLSDIQTRIKLYNLSLQSKNSNDINHNNIEEFFNIILKKSIDNRCSDIHIEAMNNSMIIRFRIDGILKIFYVFEKAFFVLLSSYIKLISKLDITQIRLPQDGRFNKEIENKSYDFRVSSMPTINAESIVIRILDKQNVKKDIKSLGFSSNIYKELENISKLKNGLVLISGPTGSGKSTTLYSLLKLLNNSNKKIITIEDPVEYKIEQIQQVSINEDIGLGFNKVLKNILRQDPDIILIGEIRDKFSLDIALQASLTGHLVLASIHSNSSVETLSRLVDLQADTYLLSTTLKYVFSQRLVLLLCKNCKKKGCTVCNFTGFHNRSSICEVLKVDENISSMIFLKNDVKLIKEHLKNTNFVSILDDGKEKVKEGLTTFDELYKVVCDEI